MWRRRASTYGRTMNTLRTICIRILWLFAATFVGLATLLGAAAAVLAGPTVWSQLSGRVQVETIRMDAVDRHARVYRPARRERRPALVLNLQAAGGNGAFQEAITGFDLQADRLGWIAAYPDSDKGGWAAFGCCENHGQADAGFLAALIDRLATTDDVDLGRVFVTGASRGGMMAYRAGCELSSRVAAIAPVAGNMAAAGGSVDGVACRPDRPVSVLDIHGSEDPEIPIDGGRSRMNSESVAYAPLEKVIARWRSIDGCAASSQVSASAAMRQTTWRCLRGSTVSTVIVSGAGHTWPGAMLVNPPGTPAASVDASRMIADFFAAHARKGSS